MASGMPPSECPICGNSFAFGDLQAHFRAAHLFDPKVNQCPLLAVKQQREFAVEGSRRLMGENPGVGFTPASVNPPLPFQEEQPENYAPAYHDGAYNGENGDSFQEGYGGGQNRYHDQVDQSLPPVPLQQQQHFQYHQHPQYHQQQQICTSIFKTTNDLLKHIRRVHRRDFVCPWEGCTWTFSVQEKLREHYDCIHLGIKDYCCGYCDKEYAGRSSLIKHLDAVHPGRGAGAKGN